MIINPVTSLAVLAWVLGFAVAAGLLAALRDRRIVLWMGFGAILGPVALALLFFAPRGRCWACRSRVAGWSATCPWCGSDVTAHPSKSVIADQPPATERVSPPADQPPATERVSPPVAAERAPATASERHAPAVVVTSGSPSREPAPAAGPLGPTPVEDRRMLATGIFVTGTVALRLGSRYLITVQGDRLQVLGPLEETPTVIAFDRPLADMDATGLNERLIINQAGHARGDNVLVFMAVGGGHPEAVADAITGYVAPGRAAAS